MLSSFILLSGISCAEEDFAGKSLCTEILKWSVHERATPIKSSLFAHAQLIDAHCIPIIDCLPTLSFNISSAKSFRAPFTRTKPVQTEPD
jgi:hypothetical protein